MILIGRLKSVYSRCRYIEVMMPMRFDRIRITRIAFLYLKIRIIRAGKNWRTLKTLNTLYSMKTQLLLWKNTEVGVVGKKQKSTVEIRYTLIYFDEIYRRQSSRWPFYSSDFLIEMSSAPQVHLGRTSPLPCLCS